MATLAERHGGKEFKFSWSSLVRASCASMGETLLTLVGLYRRGGKDLVTATLVWRHGDKRHNRPCSG